MSAQKQIICFLLIFSGIFNHYFFVHAKLLMKKLENCDNNVNYKSKYNVTIKTVGDAQYMDGTFTLTAPVDNHIRANASVEMLIGNQYVYLFSINENKSCDAMNKYVGELWYDIERCAQMIPGLCPLAMGRYHLHNCLLNYDKMTTLNNFPFGKLRLIVMMYDNKNAIFSCILLEADNRF